MNEAQYLSGRLLLAMPGMFDANFDHAVIVMCQHDESGAFGIGVGHIRAGLRFRELLEDVGVDPGVAPDCPVHHGGPVEPGRGFVLHSADWRGDETIQINGLCVLSASLDILRAIAEGSGPSHWLISLGYAGWGAGQLDGEMRHHGWYAAEGRSEILFDTSTEARWRTAWRAEGIDPALLSNVTGQA
jgi:putative transcriptional regulator